MKELYKYGDLVTVSFRKPNNELVCFTAIVDEVEYYKGSVLYDIKVPTIGNSNDCFFYMKGVDADFLYDYNEAVPEKETTIFPEVVYDDSIIIDSDIPNIEL